MMKNKGREVIPKCYHQRFEGQHAYSQGHSCPRGGAKGLLSAVGKDFSPL